MKTHRKFTPAKIPRYLPGQVADNYLQDDLSSFNIHRLRVFNAKPLVDCRPPKLNPFTCLNRKRMLEDALRCRRIDKDNKELLKKITTINRVGGRIDSYNPQAYRRINKWSAYNRDMEKLDLKNFALFQLLKDPLSYYDTEKLRQEWKKTLKQVQHICRYPVVIVQKSTLDEDLKKAQSISHLMLCKRLELRPHCFLDFSIKNGIFLGRIIIELYYDHVPVSVKNFLELCKGDELSYRNNLVHRIILGEYMEMGDITHCTGRGGCSIYGKNFPEENHKLRHTKAGVLSMKRVGWAENNSQFCITFKKMERLDHKNVVFGNVIKGNDVLMNIQYYGRKIGKPLEAIIISDCGECDVAAE
ncbi:E3 SUMO-protein ligase RanBP2 [Dendroctonus ponderosae]|uniref:PPIase cyclophilin-type domain-containing protein n=1 Tax=Dendroctonus ponderosae TaxID=77166 RepID=A0AAR5P983_DENPD|nr:E3 SUMO-protein ligase RanBP2 [Dendroctonus ponderosae]KAH1022597.1 hypothetical protein HUJ04_011976 [Dendroctonus ponderosae]